MLQGKGKINERVLPKGGAYRLELGSGIDTLTTPIKGNMSICTNYVSSYMYGSGDKAV